MVVLATVDSENFYKKRDFAKLDKPPLIGHSAYGKKLKEKIKKNASILRLFPSCVILFKILSENCFTKFVSSSRINFDFMTAEHAAVIRFVEAMLSCWVRGHGVCRTPRPRTGTRTRTAMETNAAKAAPHPSLLGFDPGSLTELYTDLQFRAFRHCL